MSELSYYKMLVVGKKLNHRIKHARKMCTQNPKSQQCKIAWEQVEETYAMMPESKIDYSVSIEDQDMFAPELEWEPEYDKRFYDV
tara:strand:+ start:162 stop:416 length:255 start_codon:yes stop_codon:yes gene_type:complete